MSSAAEPPNGDFVAYIEQLQRESAARILAQSKQAMVELPTGRAPRSGSAAGAATVKTEPRSSSPSPKAPDPADIAHPQRNTDSLLPLSRLEADKLLARLASDRATAQQVGAVIALIVGVLLILYWFGSRAGVVPLLAGAGLLVWSIRRLRRAATQRANAGLNTGRDVIAKVFGQHPPSA